MKPKSRLRIFLLACGSLLAASSIHAGNTWDGDTDGLWNEPTNWNPDGLPNTGALTFAGDIQTSTTNDIGTATYGGINFTNNGTTATSAFTLAGASITLGGNVTTTAYTGGPIADVISLGLALNADRTVTTNTNHNLEISGIISDDGNRQLIKTGSGVLTLSGANTFGRLNHDVGTVRAGAAGTVFGDVDVNLAGGTTLDLDGNNVTIGGLETSSGSNITLGAGTLTFGDGSNRTVRSVFSGSGGKIIFAGTAQHQFGANSGEAPTNTHTGGTQVDSGTLRIYKDVSLGALNGDVIFNGGTIYVNGGDTLTSPSTRDFILNNVAGNRINFQGNNDWQIEGPISGLGGISLRNPGNGDTIARLFGSNTFEGELVIESVNNNSMRVWVTNLTDSAGYGNVVFGEGFNNINDNGNSSQLVLDASATADLTLAERSIEFRQNVDASGYLRNQDSDNAMIVSSALVVSGPGLKTLTLDGTNGTPVNVFSGDISDGSGTVKLRKVNGSQWTLSGANTHTGGTELAAGTLIVSSAAGDALGAGPLNRTGGTLKLGANQNVSALYVNGVQQPNGVYTSADLGWLDDGGLYTLTVGSVLPSYWDLDNAAAGPGDTAGVVDGTWDASNAFWTDSSAGDIGTNGTWTAGRAATFSAGTTANGTSTVTVDGTQSIGGLTFQEGNVTLASGTTPALQLTSDALVIVNNGATGTVDAPITGPQALTVSTAGSGTLTLGGTNTYTGTTNINGGTLIAGSTTALGNGGDVTFGGGTLRYNSASAAVDFSAGGRMVNSTSAITVDTNGESVTLAGDIDSTNTGGLAKQGAGTLTLTGTNSYSGTTTISGGSLVIDGGTTNTKLNLTAANTAMSVTNNGTLNSSGVATFAASDVTMSVVGGSGVTSTWDLGSTDLSTGNTSYDNQQLVIDGAGFAGSAVVTGVNKLRWGRTNYNSDIVITDGGQMNVTGGDVEIGNTYYSTIGGSTMTIGGGTATSTFTGSTGRDFYIGYGERENSNNNVVTVNSGGVLTSVRNMYVGHVHNAQGNDNPSTANQLTVTGTGTASMNSLSLGYVQSGATPGWVASANVVEVTNGGTLSTLSGTSYIGRADVVDGSISSANTATITGTGSSWNAGGQTIYVGYTGTKTNSTSNDNVLTVGTGGALTNVNSLIVGDGSGTETGNQLVVNGSLTASSVSVSSGNNLGGTGTITGPVSLAAGATATFTQGSPMTIDGAVTYNNNVIHLNLPAGLGNGVYTLVDSTAAPSGSPNSAPVVDSGSYGSGGSGAISLSSNDLVLTVTGVGGGSPYDSWASTNAPSPQTPDQDYDGDGVSNAVEFVLGGLASTNDLDKLPAVASDGTNMTFTFERDQDSIDPSTSVEIEVGTDLATWGSSYTVGATSGTSDAGVTVSKDDPGVGTDTVTLSVVQAPDAKKFARLKVVITP